MHPVAGCGFGALRHRLVSAGLTPPAILRTDHAIRNALTRSVPPTVGGWGGERCNLSARCHDRLRFGAPTPSPRKKWRNTPVPAGDPMGIQPCHRTAYRQTEPAFVSRTGSPRVGHNHLVTPTNYPQARPAFQDPPCNVLSQLRTIPLILRNRVIRLIDMIEWPPSSCPSGNAHASGSLRTLVSASPHDSKMQARPCRRRIDPGVLF